MDKIESDKFMKTTQSTLPSVLLVIPVFNEEKVIYDNLQVIAAKAAEIEPECSLSLLIVDDGSTDGTVEELARYCAEDKRARWIGFTRHFGKEAAIHAGLDHADADAVIVMDSDLQHPPELIPQMVALWKKGLPVVEAWKSERGKESFASRIFAAAFYALFGYFSGLDLRGQSDFKLLDRRVVLGIPPIVRAAAFFSRIGTMDELSQCTVAFRRPASRCRPDELGALASVTVCARQFDLIFSPAITANQLDGSPDSDCGLRHRQHQHLQKMGRHRS